MQISVPDFCLIAVAGGSDRSRAAFVRSVSTAADAVAAAPDDGVAALPLPVDALGIDVPGFHSPRSDALAIVEAGLAARRLTVVDAEHLDAGQRGALVTLARRHHADAIGIALAEVSQPGARGRQARLYLMRRVAKVLERVGFRTVHEIELPPEPGAVVLARTPLWPDRRGESGPFDIIGDVHGCADELIGLLGRLGYAVRLDGAGSDRRARVAPPRGRRVVFVGDLVDRGPRSPDVLRIAMAMVAEGSALAVPGNHDVKFLRWLHGRTVKPTHGLDLTIAQMEADAPELRRAAREFLDGLGSHLWLEGGSLVVAHAGIAPHMIGRESGEVREFCLYGDTDGIDAAGLPIRYHWAGVYTGETSIVYGHTPVARAEWLNRTLCLDTGCCFGGALSALRWPENEIVSVPARETYAERRRPFGHPPLRPQPGLAALPQ